MLLNSQPDSLKPALERFHEIPTKTSMAEPAEQHRPTGVEGRRKRAVWPLIRAMTVELLYSYSTILFLRSKLIGSIILLSSFINVNLGISGIISWLTTIAFGRLIGIRKGNPIYTIYSFNALIVGFSIGFLFRISPLSFLLTAGASILTVLVSSALFSLLSKQLKLPVLNLPFLIVSTIIYLASVRYGSLFLNPLNLFQQLDLNVIPDFLQGLLRSLGILIFMPYDFCGILLLVALLFFSRIAFFMAILSYYIGTTALALLTGSFPNAYLNLYSFNFILTGIALGGVYSVASKRTYAIACCGVFISVFVLDAASIVLTSFGVPVFTLPFNLVVLLVIYVLINMGYPEVTLSMKASPEASLSNYLNFVKRFDRVVPKPFLPFSGRWTVHQGFNGPWTHRGIWKYAYDFVIQDERGLAYRNIGGTLEDYYCYGKPILSPVSGTVVAADDSLRDNLIGEINKSRRWGNYIILYCRLGYYVEISHLQFRSLKVKIGDSINVGEVLAACGNSGYSPQPHIHMQVQFAPQLGSETALFHFSNSLNGTRRLVENQPLAGGMTIEPFSFSRKLLSKLTFLVDDSFPYKSYKNGKEFGEFRLRVGMTFDGAWYFGVDGTEDRLYFGFEDNRFVFYNFEGKRNSPLEILFAALPKVPLSSDGEISWCEPLPENILFRSAFLHDFLRSFHHDFGKVTGRYCFQKDEEVTGEISNGNRTVSTRVVFDDVKGFREICVKTSGNTFVLARAQNELRIIGWSDALEGEQHA
jgi:urea transporter/murein DD-endopeptidase MepM/ murein hydrolase activator NlpD